MRCKAILLMILIGAFNVVAFDVNVDIRDHVKQNASNLTDAYMITNEAYPNRSPFDVNVHTRLFYVNKTSTNQSRTVLDVNKYAYAATSNINVTSNTTKLCVNVEAINRTDTNKSNNKACKAFSQIQDTSTEANKTNQSSDQANKTGTNLLEDAQVGDSQSTEGTKQRLLSQNDSRESRDESHISCNLLSDIPPVVDEDQTIEFHVSADNSSVTYWAENQKGKIIKSKVSTTNPGMKQYTPDDENLVVFKASRDGCNQEVASTGIKTEKTESYVNIEDVTADRPTIRATISHHDTDKRTVKMTTQDHEVGELALPGGKTRFTMSFPAVELENGVFPLRVAAGDDEDSYKYRLQEESLKDRYPNLIKSVYHRKEHFGPTTVYISLKERVNGEVVVRQRNGVERRDVNESNLDITIMPSTPTERLGIAINNRLGETVDETTHRLDLYRPDNTSEIRQEAKDAPDERSTPAVTNESANVVQNNSSESERGFEVFDESSTENNTPYVSAVGLLATLGYFAYWMRERS